MRRVPLLLSILLLLPAACARPGGGAAAPGPSGGPATAFAARAAQVAAAWQAAPGREGWRTGFVPLEDLTVLASGAGFDDDTKQAFANGWFRTAVDLPKDTPAPGTVEYPANGRQQVPLVSAAQAYAALDKGDPPPCPRGGRGQAPVPTAAPDGSAGPDTSVGRGAVPACIPLTVTGAKLGTTSLRTSRGVATVPAWIFTVEELSKPITRVAVAPTAIVPEPSTSPAPPDNADGLVSVQQLTGADGAVLSYTLGVGACDKDITPLVHETGDVVVLGGSVTNTGEMCTMQLNLAPVSVTLRSPLGARPVLDAVTGRAIVQTRQPS